MKLHNPVESIIAAENDPLAGDFYAAVRYAIDHEAMFFHTFADLRKLSEKRRRKSTRYRHGCRDGLWLSKLHGKESGV